MKSPGADLLRGFETRAARAELLAPQSAAAEAPLRFAAGLFREQRSLAETLLKAALSPKLEEAGPLIVAKARPLLRYASSGPEALAEDARRRLEDSQEVARSRLSVYWSGDPVARSDFLSRALLKPWVELLASVSRQPARQRAEGSCPFCGGWPWMSSRREQPGSHGAERHLCCALCGGEWVFARIRCPACGEADPDKLPSFQADSNPAVRVEACETCHRYVKSIDLTLDARPVPEVDDLLTLSLDLWAAEEGYQRIEMGLAGI